MMSLHFTQALPLPAEPVSTVLLVFIA